MSVHQSTGTASHSTVTECAVVPWERIEYVAAGGERSSRITDVLPDGATVSVEGLAVLFGNPSRELDFAPLSVWDGVERVRTLRPWRSSVDEDVPDLLAAFDAAVLRAMGDAEVVGVSISGGLDSLLVTYRAARLARESGRRIVVAVLDMEDDRGVTCGEAVAGQLAALDIDAELIVLPEAGQGGRTPAWSPLGPREDALPEANLRIAEALEGAGAQRILNGSGSDELLHVGLFITPLLLAAGRRRAVPAYLRDLKPYSGLLGYARETAALAAPRMSLDRSFTVALSLMFPGVHSSVPDGVLTPRLREVVTRVQRDWIEQERRLFEAHDFCWQDYSALHAICPQSIIPAATDLPVYFPFQDPGFAAAAESLPLHRRYDETLAHPYHRMKSQVVSMFPAEVRPALPTRKQTFSLALSRAARVQAESFELSVAAGLLDPGCLPVLAEHDDLVAIAAAVEDWLAGAVKQGYRVEGVTP